MTPQIPHLRIVVSVSAFVMIGFGLVSAYVIGWSDDKVTQGNILGTWQNFALLVIGFWIGSSSGGKQRPPDSPLEVDVVGTPGSPPKERDPAQTEETRP